MMRIALSILVVASGVTFSLPAFSLASVESRRGEPVVRPSPAEIVSEQAGQAMTPPEERAARLTLKEIEALQKEVSELRGLVEVQDHELKQLKKSQQDFYMDLDRRITQLSSNGAKAGAATKAQALTKEPLTKESTKKPLEKSTDKAASLKAKETLPLKETEKNVVKETTQEAGAALPTAKTPACKGCKPKELEEMAALTPSTEAPRPAEKPIDIKTTELKPSESEEGLLYQGAYNQVKTKRYQEALQSFQEYVDKFPKGEHVANARYWMGEVYMVQWQGNKSNEALLEKARTEFSNIAASFPTHPKSPDSILKLGLIALEQGDAAAAKQLFTKVKSRYPGTAAARVAESKLKSLGGQA